MTPSPDSLTEGPRVNTDRELWRETEGDTSIFRTEYGGIGINIAGNVIVKPISEWHDLARRALPAPSSAMREAVLEEAAQAITLHADCECEYCKIRNSSAAVIRGLASLWPHKKRTP